jgi:hypothetical protein
MYVRASLCTDFPRNIDLRVTNRTGAVGIEMPLLSVQLDTMQFGLVSVPDGHEVPVPGGKLPETKDIYRVFYGSPCDVNTYCESR